MKKFFVAGLLIFSTLSAMAQAQGQIKFTAKITNRNSDTLVIRGANNFEKVIPINKNGFFEANFAAPQGFYGFSDGKESSTLYLKPDSDITLTMDAKEFDETIVYTGKGTEESNFMAQQALKDEKFENEAFAKESAEFTALLDSKIKSDVESLSKGDYDPDFKANLKKSFEQFAKYSVVAYEKAAAMKMLNGKVSADFNYENYKGGKTKLSDLKGKYVYIDLWATWCAPCRAEIPFLQKIEKKYEKKNIEFVSISIDKAADHDKWKKFVLDKKLGGVQLFADKDWESEFVKSYGVNSIPRFLLIDPQGNVLDANADRPSSEELQTKLDALLK